MALKNFNVVVPTFQVEGKHICTPHEDIALFQSSYLTCILPRNLLTYLKSRTSLFFPLAWTDTDKELTTRGGTLVSTKRPDSYNSWIASSTNSACERDDLLFLKTAGSGKPTKGNKYPLSITLRIKLGVPIHFQSSTSLRSFPLTLTHGGLVLKSNSNNSLSQCTRAISATSSSTTLLLCTGLSIGSVTVGAVWVSWGESGSAISASWAIPGGSAFSCQMAEFVTSKAQVNNRNSQ